MPLDAAALSAQIFAELQKRVLDQKNPPADTEAGLRRLSDAIATAVVAYVKANAVVTVDGKAGRIT